MIDSQIVHVDQRMPDAIWIDRGEHLAPLAHTLATHASIGVDTEFLRERTFFPKLCLLQLAAGDDVWCVDTLRGGSLEPLVSAAHRRGARARSSTPRGRISRRSISPSDA